MRQARWMLPLTLLIVFGVRASPAPASCVGPTLRAADRKVPAGDELTIKGRYWFNGCQDTGSCSATPCGESECDYGPEERPKRDIKVSMRKGDQVVFLGEVDADATFQFSEGFTVPPDTPPGTYFVRAEGVRAEQRVKVTTSK